VRKLQDILAVEGVSGFIIGPYDLSASLGVPGDFHKPIVADALKDVEAIARKSGKWTGYHIVHPDRNQFMEKIERGYDFIAYGVDFTFLVRAIDDEMKMLTQAIGSSRWCGNSLAKKE
jgi:2-dehydro-3-deoxyglucarate aldolase